MHIAIEGGEGVGKSTLINILKEELSDDNAVFFAEGVLDGYDKSSVYKKSGIIQTFIFAKERKKFNHDIVLKNKDKIIVQDRSIFSSMVYQSLFNGITKEMVLNLNKFIDNKLSFPDLVILLDSDPRKNMIRLKKNGRKLDDNDLKPIEFHEEIRNSFLDIADRYNCDNNLKTKFLVLKDFGFNKEKDKITLNFIKSLAKMKISK